jgi:mono/diheme cytochrome c family protein
MKPQLLVPELSKNLGLVKHKTGKFTLQFHVGRALAVLSILPLIILACLVTGTQPSANNQPGGTLPASVDQLPAGDPARGKNLFKGQENEKVHCSACHSLIPDQTLVGPSLAGISTRAASRAEGESATAYLYQSIVEPDVYVVQCFHGSIMPGNFEKQLNGQQIADLLAFLMGN